MLLRSLQLNRFLSFGPEAEPVELGSLNVLIGPNGAGKSNFLEAIGLLSQAPRDLVAPIREGGGVGAWIWKGESGAQAELTAILAYQPDSKWNLRHRLAFVESSQRLELVNERIENEFGEGGKKPYFYFGYENGRPMINMTIDGRRMLKPADRLNPQQSVLAQYKEPDQYPELSFVGDAYESIRLYRDWTFGRGAAPRRPQPADLPTDHLLDDARNLGLILNKFRRDVPTKKALIEALQQVFDGISDFSVQIEGGTVQLFLEEERWAIPATRLSDGTVRWLALLAVLLDPSPPPLLCIDEPELGLHPDLIPSLTRLLKSASERTQLVITTQSEQLVDAFTETPEAVLVCERGDGSTTIRRLDRDKLAEWLEDYSLGDLWSKGEIGGTRW